MGLEAKVKNKFEESEIEGMTFYLASDTMFVKDIRIPKYGWCIEYHEYKIPALEIYVEFNYSRMYDRRTTRVKYNGKLVFEESYLRHIYKAGKWENQLKRSYEKKVKEKKERMISDWLAKLPL